MNSNKIYLSCAETAKLVRQSLKETFPNQKFYVRSQTYSGGASIRTRWTDGPTTKQVEAIIKRFAGSYFDGMSDYKGSIYHSIDGKEVSMGADYIFADRDYSDELVQLGIDWVFEELRGNFSRDDIPKPTVLDYRNGKLWNVQLSGLHIYGDQSVMHEINRWISAYSTVFAMESPTANSVRITGDDGYGQSGVVLSDTQAA